MSYLRDISSKRDAPVLKLSAEESFSVFYHDLFEYPLTFSEIIRWTLKKSPNKLIDVKYKNGYYFLENRECLIYKRTLRKRISRKKTSIAKKACQVISLLPSIKFVGITGSLAMNNAKRDSDIDFIIITKKGKLWSTRLLVYFLLKIAGYPVRVPGKPDERDKLCLNMWLDESSLIWPSNKRNLYTAHEILQIVPLLNRGKTSELFLYKNKWALNYWPNAQKIKNINNSSKYTKLRNLSLLESILFKLQFLYLKPKLTKESVSISKGIFHPKDLGKEILEKMHLTEKF